MAKKYTLAAILINIFTICFFLLLIGLINTQNINIIYIILIIISCIVTLFLIIKSYLSIKNSIYNIGIFYTILSIIILIYNISELNNKYSYIENIFKNEYTYPTYNIYVRKKNTMYNDISKLNGKKIGLLNENEEYVKEYLDQIGNINYSEYNTVDELVYAINNGEIQSFIISSNDLNNYKKNDIKEKMRVIYSNKIKKS